MDSILREILERHEYQHSTDYEMSYCSCGVDTPGRKAWLDHIESLESQQAKTRGKGMEHFPVPDDAEQTILPPQRSMTPEESANLAAYHKTKFKRVPAQGTDGLEDVLASLEKPRADSAPERSAIFADASYLVRAALPSHDAALIQKRDREWALVCAEHDIAALADSNGPIKLDSAALKASVREEVLHEAIRHYGDTEEEFLHWLIETHDTAHRALASEKAVPEDVSHRLTWREEIEYSHDLHSEGVEQLREALKQARRQAAPKEPR